MMPKQVSPYPAPGGAARPPDQTELRLKETDSKMEGKDTIILAPRAPLPNELFEILEKKIGLDERAIETVVDTIVTESAMAFLRSRIARRG